ncbi:MAG: branched chain amino acid aminotransferase [Bdellovibrio sp.]|nr:MAG: branched chain amino acid aminotransferase [Bdellovibrio sp.]
MPQLPPAHELGFGKYFADQIFMARYTRQGGWVSEGVLPYQALKLDPAACVLHYGQALFEGLKAFRQKDGGFAIFRPEFNWKRMCDGADRLCMEAPPRELWMTGLVDLINRCVKWFPEERGTAIYIRPTLIGTEAFLGVRPSNEFLFFVILSPVGNYYSEDSGGVKIWVEKEYLRAAPGGLGATKAAANYAGSLKAAQRAKKKGYAQVLWLDHSRTAIEEVGTMNVFFRCKNEVVTPELDGSILEGGTRAAVIELLREAGHRVTERKLLIREVIEAQQKGELLEAFGTGTAAVITSIAELASDDFKIQLPRERKVTFQLFDQLSAIQRGEVRDSRGWMVRI